MPIIKCDICEKEFHNKPYLIKINKHHYCSRSCMAKGKTKFFSGINNFHYGKSPSIEVIRKQSETKRRLFAEGKLISYNKGKGIKHKVTCYVCKKDFELCGIRFRRSKHRFFCSRACWSNQGKVFYCDYCGEKIILRECESYQKKSKLPKFFNFCNNQCRKDWMKIHYVEFCKKIGSPIGLSGEESPNWQGGTSFRSYGLDFNKKFKQKIKERDNFCCKLCGINIEDAHKLKRVFQIHHINYCKTDNFPQNCISLCNNCHGITNMNRNQWKSFFQNLLKEIYQYEYTQEQKIILDFTNIPKKMEVQNEFNYEK